MPIVDIYCRTATDGPETKNSLDRQEAVCRVYCEAHGLTVDTVHREIAAGSTYQHRNKLNLMRGRYLGDNIESVVVSELDRLSRSPVHLAILLREMEEYDVTLHCAGEPLDHAINGKLVRFILDFIAAIEREVALEPQLPEPDYPL
jgi:DNA invertase Pin-like site-specific DNA recombinase